MENIDILKRLRYALDIKDSDMVEIFKLGGIIVTKADVQKLLAYSAGVEADSLKNICNNHMLESFLNGFIIFKRGRKEVKPGESDKPNFLIEDDRNVNNVFLKKVKIALAFTGEDMLAAFKAGGVELSNGELSALLRREGQRNYKVCGDRYIRVFLKGLIESNAS
ncbi:MULTISPECIES: DUF1456 family protein [Lacrimispora]|jgi:uncharacterized protein YehS (DUF1456 family)|uniref:DUF1456 family protein n=1 Tax=Lacrimispora TaxID=2719231 RepID=UPI000BE3D88C|nr:DUF1456 family protein [Lacrimispora amygdalina]MDK2967445.1 hypothetical protein [Lacrimispora sp.]